MEPSGLSFLHLSPLLAAFLLFSCGEGSQFNELAERLDKAAGGPGGDSNRSLDGAESIEVVVLPAPNSDDLFLDTDTSSDNISSFPRSPFPETYEPLVDGSRAITVDEGKTSVTIDVATMLELLGNGQANEKENPKYIPVAFRLEITGKGGVVIPQPPTAKTDIRKQLFPGTTANSNLQGQALPSNVNNDVCNIEIRYEMKEFTNKDDSQSSEKNTQVIYTALCVNTLAARETNDIIDAQQMGLSESQQGLGGAGVEISGKIKNNALFYLQAFSAIDVDGLVNPQWDVANRPPSGAIPLPDERQFRINIPQVDPSPLKRRE